MYKQILVDCIYNTHVCIITGPPTSGSTPSNGNNMSSPQQPITGQPHYPQGQPSQMMMPSGEKNNK
jgi:hypothetical protein